jgi:hypothetical protein
MAFVAQASLDRLFLTVSNHRVSASIATTAWIPSATQETHAMWFFMRRLGLSGTSNQAVLKGLILSGIPTNPLSPRSEASGPCIRWVLPGIQHRQKPGVTTISRQTLLQALTTPGLRWGFADGLGLRLLERDLFHSPFSLEHAQGRISEYEHEKPSLSSLFLVRD